MQAGWSDSLIYGFRDLGAAESSQCLAPGVRPLNVIYSVWIHVLFSKVCLVHDGIAAVAYVITRV